MATDVTGTVLRGIGLPYVLTPDHIWDAELTATQQGPTAGRAVPQGSYSLSLQTAGTQSASKALRVKAHRGGHPGPGGAEAIYQYDGDTNWRGNDVQPTSALQVIRSTAETLTSAVLDPDAVRFFDANRNDKIAVVYQRQTASNDYLVECAVYDPSAGTWSKSTVHTSDVAPTDGYHPAIAFNPRDGFLYVCHWIYDTTAELAQIATHRSQDGATWETVSDWALDEGVDISGTAGAGTAGYEVGRLRMAFSGGQTLLVAHLIANNTSATRDQVGQFASVNRGGRFTTVEKSIVTIASSEIVFFSSHSVYLDNGKLTVTFPTVINGNRDLGFLTIIRLPSAFATISARAVIYDNNNAFAFKDNGSLANGVPIDIPSGVLINDTDGSVWVDEDGTVNGAFRAVDSGATSQHSVYMIRSSDGSAFKYTGDGDAQGTQTSDAVVVYTGDTSTYLTSFVGVSHRGRQVLIGINTTDVTTDVTLFALFLGGPTTVQLPARVAYPALYQASSWGISYLPFELPTNVGSLVTSGSGTDSIGTNGLLNRATSAATQISYFTPTSTIAQGLIVRYAHTLNSGGSLSLEQDMVSVRVADGTDDYQATLRFDGTGFRMWDDNAGSQIGVDKTTVDPNSGIDVLVAIVAGKFSCWFRAASSLSDRDWTSAIQNHSLTDDTSTPTGSNQVRFGINATSTTDIDVHEIHVMAGSHTNGKLGAGQTNPDDLRGRTLPRRGRTIGVDDGVQLTAVDGSAKKGDAFNIDTAYEHPIERILHRESPSPRTQWRSTAVTGGAVPQQRIPFVVNPDATTLGASEQDFGSTLQYVTLKGINWKDGGIERYDTGTSAWVEVAAINNAITTSFSLTRRGNQLIIPSIPTTTTGRYFAENECKGWTVKMGSTYRVISGNTPGVLTTQTSSRKAVFFLADIDDSEPTSSTITLIPDSVTITYHTDGETGGGWAIRIDAQGTAPYTVDGTAQWDLRIGHLSMGRVLVFGTQYGHGRTIMWDADDRTETTPANVTRVVRTGPGSRRFRIAWPDPIDTSQVQGTATDPDYLSSTSTAGNLSVAAQKGLPFDLLGAFQRQGAQDPITYIPRIEVSTGSTDVLAFRQYHQHALCRITSAYQMGNVLGDESDSSTGELFRVSTAVLEEIV